MFVITPSLYSSYRYFRYFSSKEEDDFLKVLKKIPTPWTPEMVRGMKFENAIRDASNQQTGDVVIDEIASIVKNGEWQKCCQKEFHGNLVRGIIDVYFPFWIYDIKYVESYKLMKYAHSIQHLVYMYCTGVKNFDYLIGIKGKEFVKESYDWNEFSEGQLKRRIDEMLDFIFFVPKFREAFEKNWSVN